MMKLTACLSLIHTEQAMSSMDSVLDVLRTKLDQLGLEIKRLTTEQLDTGKDNEEELRSAKLAIEVCNTSSSITTLQ
jgi:hypothetical protein